MAKNPNPIIVPCHRVIKSNGDVGLFSYKEGTKTKITLLQKEGIDIAGEKVIGFKNKLFRFSSRI